MKIREVAAVRIQKQMRQTLARKRYIEIKFSANVLQTGFRAMAACNKFRYRKQAYRKQTSASTTIQVRAMLLMLGKLCFVPQNTSNIGSVPVKINASP